MKATCSVITGVCIFGERAEQTRSVCSTPEICDIDTYLPISLSAISDWAPVESLDAETMLAKAGSTSRLARTASLLVDCLAGLDPELQQEAVEQVDISIRTHVSSGALMSRLLLAPLKDVETAANLAGMALAHGFAAVADVLERVVDLQPMLRRFADNWLDIPDSDFSGSSRGRQELWWLLATEEKLPLLIAAADAGAFTNIWNSLAFSDRSPVGRSAIVRLGKTMCQRQFEGVRISASYEMQADEIPPDDQSDDSAEKSGKASRVLFERAIKQVDAIRDAVAQGHDQRARRFLRELVEEQTRGPELHKYAIKSLCNIAKLCAGMFRTDFENECLQTALMLDPHDSWTLIQLGDHYKRVGEYNSSLRVLQQAVGKDRIVAESSIADVYAQQGQHEKANSLYQQIPYWESYPEIRTAIADNLRRMGRFEEAEAAYASLQLDGYESDRVAAGRAEIARRQGNLSDAQQLYEAMLQREDLDPWSRQVYTLSLSSILKQCGMLHESYKLVDGVIREMPFNQRARILRASILGLWGRESEGLAGLSQAEHPRAFGEWVQHYVGGLLLLKLGRYSEARKQLIDNLQSACVASEEQAILRLGAAVAHLMQDELTEAMEVLDAVPVIHDRYAEYLATVLRFHAAMARSDRQRIRELSRELETDAPSDSVLRDAVRFVRRRQFSRAYMAELQALLRLAA